MYCMFDAADEWMPGSPSTGDLILSLSKERSPARDKGPGMTINGDCESDAVTPRSRGEVKEERVTPHPSNSRFS
jgi:hypothetical protein